MSGVICGINNWTAVDNIEQLKSITAESLGPRHRPINHGDVLDMFIRQAKNENISLTKINGKLSPDNTKYMMVADISENAYPDFSFTLGFINTNDRSKAFTGLCGTRVFICSNGVITGVVKQSKTRHSINSGDRILDKVNSVYAHYNEHKEKYISQVDYLKTVPLDDKLIGLTLTNLIRKRAMGSANIARIIGECDNPTFNKNCDNSAWRLYNAASYVAKNIDNPLNSVRTSKIIHDTVLSCSGWDNAVDIEMEMV